MGVEAEEHYITKIGHYSYRYTRFGEEPAVQCRINLRDGLIVIEAWFGGY